MLMKSVLGSLVALLLPPLFLGPQLAGQTQSTLGTSRTTTPEDYDDPDVYIGGAGPFGTSGASARFNNFQRPIIISGNVRLED